MLLKEAAGAYLEEKVGVAMWKGQKRSAQREWLGARRGPTAGEGGC